METHKGDRQLGPEVLSTAPEDVGLDPWGSWHWERGFEDFLSASFCVLMACLPVCSPLEFLSVHPSPMGQGLQRLPAALALFSSQGLHCGHPAAGRGWEVLPRGLWVLVRAGSLVAVIFRRSVSLEPEQVATTDKLRRALHSTARARGLK